MSTGSVIARATRSAPISISKHFGADRLLSRLQISLGLRPFDRPQVPFKNLSSPCHPFRLISVHVSRNLPRRRCVLPGSLPTAKCIVDSTMLTFRRFGARRDCRRGRNLVDHLRTIIKSREIDLLAIGTHSGRAEKKLVFGSVADQIYRLVDCPVLTAPPEFSSGRM